MKHKPILIELDKKGAEWVVVAYLADDPTMIDVVETGKDAHAVTGHMISKVPIETIKEEASALGHETDPDLIEIGRKHSFPDLALYGGFIPRSMTIRQMGKKSNHALNYGMTYRRFSMENEVPERESKQIVTLYDRAYPGVQGTFHLSIRRQLEHDRTLTNCFGRKRRFLHPWGDDLFKEAYSFIPQSTVVDSVNQGLVHVCYKETPPNGFILPQSQVHDSILVKAYYTNYQDLCDAILRIDRAMSPTLHYNGHDFKIATECKMGYSWGEQSMHEVPLDSFDAFVAAVEAIENGAQE